MNLILVAPCSLVLGAAVQILVAKLVSARTKGILATLFCLPSLLAVAALVRPVAAGQSLDVKLFAWDGPLALVLHVDALSVLFALMGAGIGGFVLLYSIGLLSEEEKREASKAKRALKALAESSGSVETAAGCVYPVVRKAMEI